MRKVITSNKNKDNVQSYVFLSTESDIRLQRRRSIPCIIDSHILLKQHISLTMLLLHTLVYVVSPSIYVITNSLSDLKSARLAFQKRPSFAFLTTRSAVSVNYVYFKQLAGASGSNFNNFVVTHWVGQRRRTACRGRGWNGGGRLSPWSLASGFNVCQGSFRYNMALLEEILLQRLRLFVYFFKFVRSNYSSLV